MAANRVFETNGHATRVKHQGIRVEKIEGGSTERTLLFALLTDPQFVAQIADHWRGPGLFRSQHANIVGKAAIDHYRKHGEPIGEGIAEWFRKWATDKRRDKAVQQSIDSLLASVIRENYEPASVGLSALLETAESHFAQVAIDQHFSKLEAFKDAGQYGEAATLAASFVPFSLSDHSGIECAADAEMRRVRFLFKPYLAIGYVSLLEGDPDTGKTTLTCDLVARATRGYPTPPLRRKTKAGRRPKSVLYITSEDGWQDTTVPRLTAAKADLKRVYRWAGGRLSLPSGLARLERIIKQTESRLVIFDPIKSFMDDGLDDNKQTDVRKIMDPLKALAEKHRAAVLLIRHFRKDNRTAALHAGGGSGAWTQSARIQIMTARHEDGGFILMPSKANIVRDEDKCAVRYWIEPATVTIEGLPTEIGHIEWGKAVDEHKTADEWLRRSRPAKSTRSDDAAALIKELLNDGPMPSDELETRIRGETGVSKRTYEKAVKMAGAIRRKTGMKGKWETLLE